MATNSTEHDRSESEPGPRERSPSRRQADPDGLGAAAWIRARGQAWIDRRIGESTIARESLQELDGHVFEIVVEGMELAIVLVASEKRLEWVAPGTHEPDARLSATPLDLVALARARSVSDLKRTDARLEGNIRIAEAFADLLGRLSSDPEAELAGWVGDIAAHGIAEGARGLIGLARRSARALEQDAAEYLKEEQPMLARPWEVEEFVDAVDELRDDVERAERRIDALTRS